MTQLAFIKKFEAFETLFDEERAQLASLVSDQKHVRKGRDILFRGEQPPHVHVILQGWAARYAVNPDGSRRITALLLPGDFCDIHVTALAVMDHGVIALIDCRVGLISKTDFDGVARSTPTLTLAFWRSTLLDEAIVRRWLPNTGRRTAYQNVAHLLCELHVRLRLIGMVDADRFDVPLTQQDMADATGMTAIHINRMLRALRIDGVIEIQSPSVFIKDVPALRAAAHFDPLYLHLGRVRETEAPDRPVNLDS